MKGKRAYWTEKLKVARSAWSTLRPGGKFTSKHADPWQFSFFSVRSVSPDVKYSILICGDPFDDGWILKAFLGFQDLELAPMETAITGNDRSAFPQFDIVVPLAASALDSETPCWSPHILSFEASDDEVVSTLATYSQSIDRLCQFAGGYDVEAFRTLAKWCLRRRSGIGYKTIGGTGSICMALEYGDRALAIELLREVEEQWAENLRQEPERPIVQKLYLEYRNIHAKLRRLMDLPVPD